MNPRVSLIVAMAKNRVIGINNTLPWHLPADLKHFKALTMGHHIVMGRKTYESIGRPLPGRTSVVVTRNRKLKIATKLRNPLRDEKLSHAELSEGCIVVHTLEDALAVCAGDDEIFVVGGAELYALALPIADKLYITEIQKDVQGDAYFPVINRNEWREISREMHSQQEPLPLEYHFTTWLRIKQ